MPEDHFGEDVAARYDDNSRPMFPVPGSGLVGPVGSGRHHPAGLTDQESLVLAGAAGGYSNRGIADILHVGRKTVEADLSSVFFKLDVGPRPERNQRVCAALYWTTVLAPPSATKGTTEWSSLNLRYWT